MLKERNLIEKLFPLTKHEKEKVNAVCSFKRSIIFHTKKTLLGVQISRMYKRVYFDAQVEYLASDYLVHQDIVIYNACLMKEKTFLEVYDDENINKITFFFSNKPKYQTQDAISRIKSTYTIKIDNKTSFV